MQGHAESSRNFINKSVLGHKVFFRKHVPQKIVVLNLQTALFLSKNRVLQVSGLDTLQNATKITSKSKFSTHFVQISSHLHPAVSYSLHVCSLGLNYHLPALHSWRCSRSWRKATYGCNCATSKGLARLEFFKAFTSTRL